MKHFGYFFRYLSKPWHKHGLIFDMKYRHGVYVNVHIYVYIYICLFICTTCHGILPSFLHAQEEQRRWFVLHLIVINHPSVISSTWGSWWTKLITNWIFVWSQGILLGITCQHSPRIPGWLPEIQRKNRMTVNAKNWNAIFWHIIAYSFRIEHFPTYSYFIW